MQSQSFLKQWIFCHLSRVIYLDIIEETNKTEHNLTRYRQLCELLNTFKN